MFSDGVSLNDLLFMAKGAGITLALTIVAALVGTVLGLVFGIARASAPWWISAAIGGVLDLFRSVPLLIQLILFNSLNSILGINTSPFFIGCASLSIYTAALTTEVFRSGILAVPATTRRAARSLGMTWLQDFSFVALPISVRVIFPSWISVVLGVMKDTSLVLWIGIIELLRSSQIVVTRTQEPLLVLCITGAIYFALSYLVTFFARRVEERWEAQ